MASSSYITGSSPFKNGSRWEVGQVRVGEKCAIRLNGQGTHPQLGIQMAAVSMPTHTN